LPIQEGRTGERRQKRVRTKDGKDEREQRTWILLVTLMGVVTRTLAALKDPFVVTTSTEPLRSMIFETGESKE
jgi:hypothetical protein